MLPEVLAPNLKLVICGSAAGEQSARLGAYYAGRGNTFWETLHAVGLTPHQLRPTEFATLLEYGIGLTDLVKDQKGMDHAIRFGAGHATRLDEVLIKWEPRILCFNGKRSAREYFNTSDVGYGLQTTRVRETRLFVAPSTSGAARRAWDLSVWERLADLVRDEVE